MSVKHIPTEIIHKDNKCGITGCGVNTKEKPTHWINTASVVTCDKNGCNN